MSTITYLNKFILPLFCWERVSLIRWRRASFHLFWYWFYQLPEECFISWNVTTKVRLKNIARSKTRDKFKLTDLHNTPYVDKLSIPILWLFATVQLLAPKKIPSLLIRHWNEPVAHNSLAKFNFTLLSVKLILNQNMFPWVSVCECQIASSFWYFLFGIYL